MAEKKKTTTKKTTSKKKAKNVKLTFSPLFSASESYTCYLWKKSIEIINGEEESIRVPSIEGLPGLFTVRKGEIVEVTADQFKMLQEYGFIESKDQVEKRQQMEAGVVNQHPSRLTYDTINVDDTLSSRDMTNIYSDKLIVVE